LIFGDEERTFAKRNDCAICPVAWLSTTMAVLAQVIAALNILSTSFEMIPLVGENLKAATELAAKICEGAQVRWVVVAAPIGHIRPS
jgi:hypothetical protein